MRIVVFPGVLRPPSDAALLGGVMARDANGLRGREVLDLCTGTGSLGLTAAKLGARATAIDLARRAVLNARLNARLNHLDLEVLRGDLFAPVEGRRFDLVVSNPPYIPAPPDNGEPQGASRAWDAGPDGRAFLDRICDRAADHLRPGGRILLVHSSLSDPAESERRLAAAGLSPRVAAEDEGELGPIAREREDYLRSIGVVGDDRTERMVVVEGRLDA
jgi:release factor glutamine methyltransferase